MTDFWENSLDQQIDNLIISHRELLMSQKEHLACGDGIYVSVCQTVA